MYILLHSTSNSNQASLIRKNLHLCHWAVLNQLSYIMILIDLFAFSNAGSFADLAPNIMKRSYNIFIKDDIGLNVSNDDSVFFSHQSLFDKIKYTHQPKK